MGKSRTKKELTASREEFRKKLGSKRSIKSLREHLKRADEKIERLRRMSEIDPNILREPMNFIG